MRMAVAAVAVVAVSAIGAASSHAQGTFRLSSLDVKNGVFAPAQISNSMGCTGGNVSPHLAWSGAPPRTKSFAITVYDPDAPTGSGWWHWLVVNIPVSAIELPNGASRNAAKLPKGALETRTDFGVPGWGGPCPPAGDKPHRYLFTIYAIKVDKLDVDAQASGAMVGFNLNANSLGKASFTATYARAK